LDAEQDCGVDEKNVGEIESFFKVLLFEICPSFQCVRALGGLNLSYVFWVFT
jgi:hypothetical protein